MGWFDSLKSALGIKSQSGIYYADAMTGRTPIYSAFGRDIYASDVVTQATACVTDEIRKLSPAHVIETGEDVTPAPPGDPLQRVLNAPNHYMTTGDFLAKTMYNYFAKANSWVVPTYRTNQVGHRTYTGLYPVDPAAVTFVEDSTGRLYVELTFTGDFEPLLLPYSDIIHLRRNYGAAEYMGGGQDGLPDDRALLTTLDTNHQMLQNIGRAMKTSQTINGVVKYNGIIGEQQTKAAMAEFEKKLQNNESGILPMDLKGEYIPITRDIKLVDDKTLKFIDEKILRNFGVPLAILTGDYTKAQYEAFYQKTIEPIIMQLSQEFTRVLFTPTESGGYGHKIRFYAKELVFMSIDQKINMINLLAPTGALYENEKRVAFGLRPLPELKGMRYVSLNWIDAQQAGQYQVGQESPQQDDGGADNEEHQEQ